MEEKIRKQTEDTQVLFNEIMSEIFPNPGKVINILVQETFRIANRH